MANAQYVQGKAAAALSLALVLLIPAALFLGIRTLMANAFPGRGDPGAFRTPADPSGSSSSFKGSESCKECHPKHYRFWAYAKHSGVSCETCHGPSGDHNEKDIDPRPRLFLGDNGDCLRCHGRTAGRSLEVVSQVPGFDEHLAEIEEHHVIQVKRAKKERKCV
ncbi:MAG: hypothetical protein ACYTHN_24500, partial [Planctomycetota bacterium]